MAEGCRGAFRGPETHARDTSSIRLAARGIVVFLDRPIARWRTCRSRQYAVLSDYINGHDDLS